MSKNKVNKTDEDWRRELTPEQYRILRQQGTEQAFTGEYWDTKEEGTYICAGCGNALFESNNKFDSGCGWPSFDQPVGADLSVGPQNEDVGQQNKDVGQQNEDVGQHNEDVGQQSKQVAIETRADNSLLRKRTEVICKKCQGHLGHVFNDGPQETTGQRFCINSAAIKLNKKI